SSLPFACRASNYPVIEWASSELPPPRHHDPAPAKGPSHAGEGQRDLCVGDRAQHGVDAWRQLKLAFDRGRVLLTAARQQGVGDEHRQEHHDIRAPRHLVAGSKVSSDLDDRQVYCMPNGLVAPDPALISVGVVPSAVLPTTLLLPNDCDAPPNAWTL